MSRGELIDRIAARAREQGGTLEAQAIARDFLRLTMPRAKAAAGLVRALLGRDHRFVEEGEGVWRCNGGGAVALEPPVLLVAIDVPDGSEREPWLWRIRGTLWGKDGPVWEHQGARATPALKQLLLLLADLPSATDAPGALGRWLGAQERLHALPERDPVVIDLRGWRRLLDSPAGPRRAPAVREPAPGSREEDSPARLALFAGELDRIVQTAAARGLRSWQQVAFAPAITANAAEEALWKTPRAFTREDLECLPEEPGIYRFFDRDGQLLYVGKSANLRRRVLSYFRPLDARSSRRGELLERLHRLEFEPAANELEALIHELREIRERRPEWNVQLDLAAGQTETPPGERAMLLVVPGPRGGRTAFLLDDERVARVAPEDMLDAACFESALRAFYDGASASGVEEIPPPERALVRRWLNGRDHGGETLRLADFESYRTVALAVACSRRVDPGDEGPGGERGEGSAAILREGREGRDVRDGREVRQGREGPGPLTRARERSSGERR